MLLLAVAAVSILGCCLWIHYHLHYRFSCHRPHKMEKQQGFCCLIPRENEDFDFFPAAFLFYSIFLMLLSILVTTVQILDITTNGQTLTAATLFSFRSNHQSLLLHEVEINSAKDLSITLCITDYALIYGVMVLALWQSLFSFYRYYTTMRSLVSMDRTPTSRVLLLFSIYALTFTLLFLSMIHIYYFLFPVVVLLHFVFNLYCSYIFSSALIKKYTASSLVENTW